MAEAAAPPPRATGPGPPAPARPSPPRSRFTDALARAGASSARPPDGGGMRSTSGEPTGVGCAGRGAPGVRARSGSGPSQRPVRVGAVEADAISGGVAAQAAPAAASDPASAPELREAVRALPPAIAAFAGRGGGELALAFGSALGVDLRSGAQGLEIALRPAPALERVARAELPGLVEALRAHGLRVARAEVRPRPQGRGGHRAR